MKIINMWKEGDPANEDHKYVEGGRAWRGGSIIDVTHACRNM